MDRARNSPLDKVRSADLPENGFRQLPGYDPVEIQKSAIRAAPGAGIGVGVWTQTNGCGWRP